MYGTYILTFTRLAWGRGGARISDFPKEEEKMKVFEIPKRSPCLNVCDYFLWAEINRRMRAKEQKFPSDKRETRKGFLSRLRRTALSLPSSIVSAAVGDMKR